MCDYDRIMVIMNITDSSCGFMRTRYEEQGGIIWKMS